MDGFPEYKACILISESYIISGIFLENRGPVEKVANRRAAIWQFSLLVFYPLIDTASCYTTGPQIMPPHLVNIAIPPILKTF